MRAGRLATSTVSRIERGATRRGRPCGSLGDAVAREPRHHGRAVACRWRGEQTGSAHRCATCVPCRNGRWPGFLSARLGMSGGRGELQPLRRPRPRATSWRCIRHAGTSSSWRSRAGSATSRRHWAAWTSRPGSVRILRDRVRLAACQCAVVPAARVIGDAPTRARVVAAHHDRCSRRLRLRGRAALAWLRSAGLACQRAYSGLRTVPDSRRGDALPRIGRVRTIRSLQAMSVNSDRAPDGHAA